MKRREKKRRGYGEERRGGGRGIYNLRDHADLELAHTRIKQLQQPCLPRVENLTLLADHIPLTTLTRLIPTKDNLALDHARRHTESPQFGLDGMTEGDIMFGRDGTTGRIDDTGGDDEITGRGGAGAGEIDGGKRGKVLRDGLGGPVGKQEGHVTGEVFVEGVDAVGDGVLGGGA